MSKALHALRQAQIDWRLVLMGAVLVGIALIFNVLSGGIFLSPENLYNIAQQTAVVGIVATVVVLIIVARHIDLSVGSVMGFVGVLVAYLMYTANWSWPAAALAGLAVAIAVSLYQGALTAVLGVPSFVVTLGGLMSFRGAAFLVADGKTQPVNDEFFQRLGGGYDGGIGVTASWALAATDVPGDGLRGVQQAPQPAALWRAEQPAVGRPGGAGRARRHRAGLRRGDEQLPDPEQGCAAGHPDPGADLGRGGDHAVLHRAPHALRPLCLRHGRQPRCGGAGRHSGASVSRCCCSCCWVC